MRYLALCAIGIALLCCTSVPATAGTPPATTGFQTIASPAGYQFQAPANWPERVFSYLPRGVDSWLDSGDGKEFVAVAVLPVPLGVQPSDLLQSAPAITASLTQAIASNGGSAVNIFQGPDSIDIAGATAALSYTASYTNSAGDRYIEGGRLAIRGDSLYLFVLRSPESFSSSDPSFATIRDSFQLTAPTLSANLATPAPAFPLSSEEAVLALLPYKLGPQDGLSGYLPSPTVTAHGAASSALSVTAFPSERLRALLQAGYIVGFAQTLEPVSQPNAASSDAGYLEVNLFDTTGDAGAAATGQSLPPVNNAVDSYQPITHSAALGEANAGWHVTENLPGRPSRARFAIRWQRGPIVFVLETQPMPLGEEQQADVETLATAIDAAEQTRPPLSLGSPTVTPPATEAQRLQAALQLKPFPFAASATPTGFEAETPYYLDAVGFLAAAADPRTELGLTDSTWKVIISERQAFTSQQTSGVTLLATATICADRQSAIANASYLSSAPDVTSTQVTAPVSLGDSTYAYRYTVPAQAGNPLEAQEIYWTHGAVVLSARMFGPPGTTSMDQVVALARQIDARYQAGLPAPSAPSRPLVR
jgi:hypothetical protein